MARPLWRPKVSHARFVHSPFTSDQMLTLGGILADAIRSRIAAGVNVNDVPARPLSPAYAKAKARRGLVPVRNWTKTGKTLQALQVVAANENRAKISFKNPIAMRIAHWNNMMERAFGVSPTDRNIIIVAVHKMLHEARVVRVIGKAA